MNPPYLIRAKINEADAFDYWVICKEQERLAWKRLKKTQRLEAAAIKKAYGEK